MNLIKSILNKLTKFAILITILFHFSFDNIENKNNGELNYMDIYVQNPSVIMDPGFLYDYDNWKKIVKNSNDNHLYYYSRKLKIKTLNNIDDFHIEKYDKVDSLCCTKNDIILIAEIKLRSGEFRNYFMLRCNPRIIYWFTDSLSGKLSNESSKRFLNFVIKNIDNNKTIKKDLKEFVFEKKYRPNL